MEISYVTFLIYKYVFGENAALEISELQFCNRYVLVECSAMEMYWLTELLWRQYCIGFSMEKILLWLMIWVKVLLWGCLKSILLWRWLSLQYCYGDGLGYSIAIEMPLVTCLLQIHVSMTAWRQLGEKFGILLWRKNVYFLPCQGMIDFWVYTNCPL